MCDMASNASSALSLRKSLALANSAVCHVKLRTALLKPARHLFYSSEHLKKGSWYPSDRDLLGFNHDTCSGILSQLQGRPALPRKRPPSDPFTTLKRYTRSRRYGCHYPERPVNIHSYSFADQTP